MDAIYLDKKQIEELKKKPKECLEINESVFLLELRVDELEKTLAILVSAHTDS